MLHPGDQIGDWVVEGPLAEGGMGAVYRVHSALSERVQAALKVLKPSGESDARDRFIREAEALSAMKHPAIVRVMSFGEDPVRGLPYLAMELALGETLKTRLERGAMSRREVLGALAPLASALEHAHAAGIFHRDIKPANIVLCEDGAVKLVDFGIVAGTEWATLTTGGHLGTLPYLPPEVFRGESPDFRSMDVYAFGLVLYEALTGERAFPVEPGLSAAGIAAAVGVMKLRQTALDVGPSFPTTLRHAIRRATSPEPRDRPSVTMVRDALESLRGPDLDRRGRGDEPEREAAASGAPSDPAGERTQPFQPDQATTRVPDPPKPAVNEPRRPRPRGPDGRAVAVWAALALVAGAAVVLLLGRADRRPAAAAVAQTAGSAPPERPVRGDRWKNPKDDLELAWVPPGRFQMGCTPGDANCDPERLPSRTVEFERGFWMGRTEVTVAAFRLFAEETGERLPEPPEFNAAWVRSDHPVVNVSWVTARKYCGWAGGRLPTEAEWEFAARGGTATRWYPWGNQEPVCRPGAAHGARFNGDGCGNGTVEVASYAPNDLGLYDLAGNVWEWCEDEWRPTHADQPDEGDGPGRRRVVRGASWVNPAPFLRVSIRSRWFEDRGRDFIGFRCVHDRAR